MATKGEGHGPITSAVMQLFHIAKFLSPMSLASLLFPILKPRSELRTEEVLSSESIQKRMKAVDAYIVSWLVAEIVVIGMSIIYPISNAIQILLSIVLTFRIVEIIQVTTNAAVFDAHRSPIGNLMATRERTIVLALMNFLELVGCFGVIYAFNTQLLVSGACRPVSMGGAFYFSAITQFTIGYGDISPVGWLRAVASAHGFVAFTFAILVISRVVSSMPPIESALSRDK
jgi:hypothetical protein